MKRVVRPLAALILTCGVCDALAQTTTGDLVVGGALISAKNNIVVSAEAEGNITALAVREGSEVAEGAQLASIDDRVAKAAVEVAQYGRDAARTKASDDIEEKYAKAAFDVAFIDWQMDMQANAQRPNAVPAIQIRKKGLDVKRSELQIEKAKKDQVIAGKEADVKDAELRAQQVNLARRQILARFAGVVQEIKRHKGEWVNPGDQILKLIQFDVLVVETKVSAMDYNPIDIANRPVTIVATQARGAKQSLTGKVVYVDQTVSVSKDFSVRAEIENRRENGYWVVRPGQPVEMTIHTTQPAVE